MGDRSEGRGGDVAAERAASAEREAALRTRLADEVNALHERHEKALKAAISAREAAFARERSELQSAGELS